MPLSHIIKNLISNLILANHNNSNDLDDKRYVVRVLREINKYFIALGTNEYFRNYEFNPNSKKFFRTEDGFFGYTEMMMPKF